MKKLADTYLDAEVLLKLPVSDIPEVERRVERALVSKLICFDEVLFDFLDDAYPHKVFLYLVLAIHIVKLSFFVQMFRSVITCLNCLSCSIHSMKHALFLQRRLLRLGCIDQYCVF